MSRFFLGAIYMFTFLFSRNIVGLVSEFIPPHYCVFSGEADEIQFQPPDEICSSISTSEILLRRADATLVTQSV